MKHSISFFIKFLLYKKAILVFPKIKLVHLY